MASFYCICFIAFCVYNKEVRSANWSFTSPQDRQEWYACAGDTVTFSWQYVLTSEEVLGDIKWLYEGQSQEIATSTAQGDFLPTPTFSQRVARVNNAGLSLSRVLVPDSGNYSVEVNVYSQAGAVHTVLRRTAVLHVSDGLMTTDGALHAVQLPDPVYNVATGQWLLQLQCGHFIFKDDPPYQVQWSTPSGQVQNSTSFGNGSFYFSVPMPIESGSYTCGIPPHLAASACLHGDGLHAGQATVTVESVEARLLLLEKDNSDLRQQLAAAKAEATQQQATLAQQQVDVSHLNSKTSELSHRLQQMEDADQILVAFHATGFMNTSDEAFVFNQVVYNQGNAYNSSTGYFTAPYSGLYFFIAKTALASDSVWEQHFLSVDSSVIDSGYAYNPRGAAEAPQSPIHGVVHLTKGQRVSVKRNLPYTAAFTYYSEYSSFTGFLLSRDK